MPTPPQVRQTSKERVQAPSLSSLSFDRHGHDAPVRCTEKGEKVIAPLPPPLPLHAHAHYSSELFLLVDRSLGIAPRIALLGRSDFTEREGGRTTPRPRPSFESVHRSHAHFHPMHAYLTPPSISLPLAQSGRLSIYLSAHAYCSARSLGGFPFGLGQNGLKFSVACHCRL